TATYGQVHDRAMAAAAALGAVGVDRGQLVGLLAPNSVGYVELYFGIALRGAAVVLVNTSFTGYMLEYVLNDAACRVLIAHESLLGALLESEGALTQLETVVVTGDAASASSWATRFSRLSVVPLAELAARSDPAQLVPVGVSPDDLHCIVYSSGTTGPSKGVMISHAHALTKASEVLRICRFGSDDVLYS